MTFRALIAALLLVFCAPAFAQGTTTPSEEEIKLRSEAIQKTLRCVVCQNQSIADSNSTLAEDMRGLVEHRVRLGDSDEEVRDYMQARYGDFVLMKPPVKTYTWLLWFGPFIFLAIGMGWYVMNVRKPREVYTQEETDLTPEEQARLNNILGKGGN